MKRSKKTALCLMVPVTTLMLAGCGEEREQAMVFSSVNECESSSLVAPDQCRADFAEAAALHPQVAPKYASKEACETDFGAASCEPAPMPEGQQQQASSGGMFMPLMMGYLAGRMLSGGQAQAGQAPAAGNSPAAANKTNVANQPLYKSRDDRGTFRTASNAPVAKGIGPISLRPSQVKPKVGQLVNRGGFGSQAAMRASNTAGG